VLDAHPLLSAAQEIHEGACSASTACAKSRMAAGSELMSPWRKMPIFTPV
jgi:hypothetical protein